MQFVISAMKWNMFDLKGQCYVIKILMTGPAVWISQSYFTSRRMFPPSFLSPLAWHVNIWKMVSSLEPFQDGFFVLVENVTRHGYQVLVPKSGTVTDGCFPLWKADCLWAIPSCSYAGSEFSGLGSLFFRLQSPLSNSTATFRTFSEPIRGKGCIASQFC